MIDASSFAATLNGKPAAVFGLGVSNLAVIKALNTCGVAVVAYDDNQDSCKAAQDCGATIKNLAQDDLSNYVCLVLAPGVPHDHPAVLNAKRYGLEILCDVEILHRCGHERKTIGITGTNGKSTTTALIGHILNACKIPVVVGGNIGKPVLSLDLPPDNGAIVLELSSFQIELCPTFRPDIAVLLNITPDHLDRHGTMENYVVAKAKLFEGDGQAVIGVDDEFCRTIYQKTFRTKRSVSLVWGADIAVHNGVLSEDGNEISQLDFPALRGVHNQQNIAAAFAVCRLMGLNVQDILNAVNSFPGLPHRQFLVRTLNNVQYINDSKATNADATAKALACFDDIYWIVGGKQKDGGLNGLESFASKIKKAFLIGAAEDVFAQWMERNRVPLERCGTLESATERARNEAERNGGGVVLLSPACASFDQFKNFEHRGEVFTALVSNFS